jgi:hypothetical protein
LISHDPQAEEKKLPPFRVGKLVEVLDAVKYCACSAPRCGLDLNGVPWPLEVMT